MASGEYSERALVHARRVIVANFLLDGAMLPGRLCLVDEIAQNVEIVLVQFIETAPSCLVRRNWIVLHPVAARVLVEIHAGFDGLVDGRQIEVRDLLGSVGGGRRTRRCCLGYGKNGCQQQRENGKRAHPHVGLENEMSPRRTLIGIGEARSRKVKPGASCGDEEELNRKHYYNAY